jgi:hypothetical protein
MGFHHTCPLRTLSWEHMHAQTAISLFLRSIRLQVQGSELYGRMTCTTRYLTTLGLSHSRLNGARLDATQSQHKTDCARPSRNIDDAAMACQFMDGPHDVA